MKHIFISIIILFASLYNVTAESFDKDSDYLISIGSTTVARRSAFTKYDISPGSFLRYETVSQPEVWLTVLSYVGSIYCNTKRIYDGTSCGYIGFKFGYKFSQWVSAGIVIDSGLMVLENRTTPNKTVEEKAYERQKLNDFYPPNIYKNNHGGWGAYGKLQYPLWWPLYDLITLAPFISLQVTTNGNTYCGFGTMICFGHYYR